MTVTDDWFKLIAEALRVLAKIPSLLVPPPHDAMTDDAPPSPLSPSDLQKTVALLHDAIHPRLEENDIDAEIKETAITAMGDLVARLGDTLDESKIANVLNLLLERMSNDITRVSALKTIGKIAQSPLKIDVSCILADATEELANFLRQHSRSLKMSSLETISALILSNSSKITDPLFELILTECAPLISDADLQVCNLAIAVSYDVLVSSKTSVGTIKKTTMANLLKIAASPLLQGVALSTTTKFLEELVMVNDNVLTFSDVLDWLLAAVESDAKQQSISNISKCVAAICTVTTDKQRNSVIDDLLADVNSTNDVKRRVALLTLGSLGERVDLSQVKGLSKSILNSFASADDASKSAASIALGHVAVGAMSAYLPIILGEIESAADDSALYLVLQSLREVINTHRSNGAELSDADITSILPHITGLANSKEEGIRNICSECFGCFVSMNPEKIIPTLTALVAENRNKTDDEPAARMLWTVLTSMKHALSGKNAKLDGLASHMTENGFLALMDEEDFEVKHAALLMVNAAVHYAPEVVAASMASFIMPRVFDFLVLTSVRTIDLGPFKHKIDDALPLRKVSLSIVDSALQQGSIVDVSLLIPQLAKCCGDVEEVVVPCHQVLVKLCARDEAIVCQHLDAMVEGGLEKAINKKIKDGTAAQDVDKINDLVRSALRVVVAVEKCKGSEGIKGWSEFVARIKKTGRIAGLLAGVEEGAAKGGL